MLLYGRRDLKSLRDLTADHVTMLKNIKQKACKVSSCQLCFCSFRLHVQFCNWSVEHTGQFATQLHYPNTIVALLDQLCNAYLYCISCT